MKSQKLAGYGLAELVCRPVSVIPKPDSSPLSRCLHTVTVSRFRSLTAYKSSTSIVTFRFGNMSGYHNLCNK